MRSDMWEHTAIFLTWDEWGGFYDPIVPPTVDHVGLGHPCSAAHHLAVHPSRRDRRRARRVLDAVAVHRRQLGARTAHRSDQEHAQLRARLRLRGETPGSEARDERRLRPPRHAVESSLATPTRAGSRGRSRSRTRSRGLARPAAIGESPDRSPLHANDVRVTRIEAEGRSRAPSSGEASASRSGSASSPSPP